MGILRHRRNKDIDGAAGGAWDARLLVDNAITMLGFERLCGWVRVRSLRT